MIELSLVLPVHNQADSIATVVAEILAIFKNEKISHEIILVENGSSDATPNVVKTIARKHKAVRSIVSPLGYGNAVLAGLEMSQGAYVSYMPSDGQADATLLPVLLKTLKEKRLDMVKIRRQNRENRVRFYNSKIFNLIANMLFYINLHDINGSPRIFARRWLPILALEYTDSFIDIELSTKARVLDWKIQELPARDLSRRGGKSTVSWRTAREFLKNFYQYKRYNKLQQWANQLPKRYKPT